MWPDLFCFVNEGKLFKFLIISLTIYSTLVPHTYQVITMGNPMTICKGDCRFYKALGAIKV